jgi:hypothetical protein
MMTSMSAYKVGWDANDSRLTLRSWLPGTRGMGSYGFKKDPDPT